MTDFTGLRPQAVELFKSSLEELAGIEPPESARQAYHQTAGYITGLNRLGVLNDTQYAAMISLLGSAMDTKKVAPGADNTESDKAKSLNFILNAKPEGVKPRAEAYVHADIYSGVNLQMEIYGEARKLLAILSCYTSDLRESGVPESKLQEAYLKSLLPREGKTNA